jgi:sarcosine oxidase, subunit gamma
MPDRPPHKPALAGKPIVDRPGLRLEPLPEGHLLHVMGNIDRAGLAKSLTAAGLATSAVRQAGYQQWYVAGDERLTRSQIALFADQLKGNGFVSDQSHGRICIAVSGSRVLVLLSLGTAVDLDLAAFPVDHSVVTLFGHISVQLTRMQETRFEITVLRSYAEDLYETLEHAAAASAHG